MIRFLLATLCLTNIAMAESVLWKQFVASPDRGPVPDFSYAGYRQGEASLPDTAAMAKVSVADFGAKGDGTTDDTDAFWKALRFGGGKVIEIPAGRYVLSDRLSVTQRATVLRGAGRGKTVLLFQRGLEEIAPYPIRNGGGTQTTGWSWDGGLITFDGRDSNAPYSLPIAKVVPRGATQLPLNLVRNLDVGQTIEVRVDSSGDTSLANYIYANSPGDVRDSGTNLLLRQLVKVVSTDKTTVTIDRPTRFDLRPEWQARIVQLDARVTDAGIESLTIEMPDLPYLGHFRERGFNGINFVQTRDCWARDIEIVNCDDGVMIAGDNTSVIGLTMRSVRGKSGPFDGHHGIYIRGTDNLIRDADLQIKFIHDVTVERGASGNVITASRGLDLCLDHHRWGPYANLWCDLDLGAGTRPWASGGGGSRGKHSGTREVFWNLRAAKALTPPDDDFAAPGCVFAGVQGLTTSPVKGVVIESSDAIEPSNLYDAQLARRLKDKSTTRK